MVVVAVAGVLFGYFIHTPNPDAELAQLSGTLNRGSIEMAGLKRTYRTYVPRGLAKGAPLVPVLHGSDESNEHIRMQPGYAFERLADQHGFAVVYSFEC